MTTIEMIRSEALNPRTNWNGLAREWDSLCQTAEHSCVGQWLDAGGETIVQAIGRTGSAEALADEIDALAAGCEDYSEIDTFDDIVARARYELVDEQD